MKWILIVLFSGILVVHFWYAAEDAPTSQSLKGWAAYSFEQSHQSHIQQYIQSGDFWLGLTYAVAGVFASYCLSCVLRMRRKMLTASAGGLTLSGILWASVCFLTGCCGSPMLPVYLSLFGSHYAEISKPLTFGLTVISIGAGYAWMLKKSRKEITTNVYARLHEDAGTDPREV